MQYTQASAYVIALQDTTTEYTWAEVVYGATATDGGHGEILLI